MILPQTSAEAAGAKLSVSPSNPVLNERVTFTGKIATRYERTIRLQRWSGSAWKYVSNATVKPSGSFTLVGKLGASSMKFRAYAPKTSRGGAVTTASRTLTATAQAGSLTFVAPPVGQSKTGTQNLTPVTVKFTPSRTGRPVQLQRKVGSTWTTIASGTLKSGSAKFQAPVTAGDGSSYRAVAASFNGAGSVASASRTATQWTRVFNDDFSSAAAFENQWSYRAVGVRGGKRMCAESSPDSVSVSGGALHLATLPLAGKTSTCKYGQFKNGHVSTAGKFDFEHGILAARIKFPAQAGQHGSLWSQPSPGHTDGSEIDVIESFGEDSSMTGDLVHNIYTNLGVKTATKYPSLEDALLPAGKDWSDGYHVFSVEWTPSEYIFRVDGTESFRTNRGISKAEQYVILSLLTSDWELDDFNIAKAGKMSVDWVRVWKS